MGLDHHHIISGTILDNTRLNFTIKDHTGQYLTIMDFSTGLYQTIVDYIRL